MAHIVCMTRSRGTLICVLRYGMALIQPKPFKSLKKPETPRRLWIPQKHIGNGIPSALGHPKPIARRMNDAVRTELPSPRLEIKPIGEESDRRFSTSDVEGIQDCYYGTNHRSGPWWH